MVGGFPSWLMLVYQIWWQTAALQSSLKHWAQQVGMHLWIIETEVADCCHAVMSAAIYQVSCGAEKSLAEDPENSMQSPRLYNVLLVSWQVSDQ